MKVLLDECVDSRLADHLRSIEITTVTARGWAGITNGQLLALAQQEFDVFVTVDRNLSFQQNLPKFNIAVVLVTAKSNRLADLVNIVPQCIFRLIVGEVSRSTWTRIPARREQYSGLMVDTFGGVLE